MRALVLLAACALVACHDDAAYPPGPYAIAVGATVPDLRFAGVDASGRFAELELSDYYTPGASDELVILVSGGPWCGTCRFPGRASQLDLVIGDRDNAPADQDAAREWQALRSGVPVGADPAHHFGALVADRPEPLPLFVTIDTGSMTIVDYASNPRAPGPLVDDFFSDNEWALLKTTTLPGPPPADPTNGVADSPAAAALGRTLFFDAGLSPSGSVSCASCHRPELGFGDGLPRPLEGDRKTPAIALAAHARWQFWDGRADSLWAQALGPFENAHELASSRSFVARRVLSEHGAAYRAAFGDPDYDALSELDRDAVTRVFVNAGKAIAAWERTLRVEPNALDAYLAGDFAALDFEQKYGLQLFVRSGCTQCHWGPRLTDDAFHDIGMPGDDRGRLDGIAAWRASEFRSDGRWSDARRERVVREPVRRQFKTPPLRGVADQAFFGHAGTFAHLSEVTELYGSGEAREPWLGRFGETVQWGLVPFLQVLTARPIVR